MPGGEISAKDASFIEVKLSSILKGKEGGERKRYWRSNKKERFRKTSTISKKNFRNSII
jgi:hypothetical protein